MSGHSKWHSIKHKKGATDAKRGKLFTKFIKEITVAARTGGGDPDANARLRKAILDAKAGNMPNDMIDRAIRRGTGAEEGVTYEEITYEGYGPGGVALLIEAMTDNRNRTVAEIRHIFSKNGGNLGESGSVGWMFDKKGYLVVTKRRSPRISFLILPSTLAPKTSATTRTIGKSSRLRKTSKPCKPQSSQPASRRKSPRSK